MLNREYNFILRSPLGNFKGYITGMFRADWTLNINKAGRLSMDLPGDTCTVGGSFGIHEFGEGDRLEIYRTITGTTTGDNTLVGETCWIVDLISSSLEANGQRMIHIEAETANGILWRRINAYNAETDQGDLLPLPCDDQMKYLVRSNFAAGAASYVAAPDPLRDLSAYFQIQADAAAVAAVYEDKAAHKSVGSILKKISEFALGANEPLFFDVVQISQVANPFLEFRTYVGQRGADRRQGVGLGAVIIQDGDGTIAEYALTYDYQKTVNRVYAGGEGKGNGRDFLDAQVPTLAADTAASPFALREHFQNASSAEDNAELQTEADQALQEKRFHVQFTGTLGETDRFMYGREWVFGDVLSAFIEGELIDVYVIQERVELSDGRETITGSFSTDYNLTLYGLGSHAQAIAENNRAIQDINALEWAP